MWCRWFVFADFPLFGLQLTQWHNHDVGTKRVYCVCIQINTWGVLAEYHDWRCSTIASRHKTLCVHQQQISFTSVQVSVLLCIFVWYTMSAWNCWSSAQQLPLTALAHFLLHIADSVFGVSLQLLLYYVKKKTRLWNIFSTWWVRLQPRAGKAILNIYGWMDFSIYSNWFSSLFCHSLGLYYILYFCRAANFFTIWGQTSAVFFLSC